MDIRFETTGNAIRVLVAIITTSLDVGEFALQDLLGVGLGLFGCVYRKLSGKDLIGNTRKEYKGFMDELCKKVFTYLGWQG